MTEITHSGFAAIIGAPNAGKSTLTNRLVGAKVSIVTHKVQTTRFALRGVFQQGSAQVVLIDTPGIFRARRRLDRAMVKAAWSGADTGDVTVHLIDASHWVNEAQGQALSPAEKLCLEDDRRIIKALKESCTRALLALNKIDLFAHEAILPVMSKLAEEGVYEEIFMLSAGNGDGVEALAEALAGRMPAGPALYPADQAADVPLQVLAAEITREKLMLRLHQELPYQLTVETESWERQKNGAIRIQQAVIVGRKGHKAMALGKGGQTIKAVGAAAREELSTLLETPVHLFLFVKVDPKWQEKRERYVDFGLDFDA